MNINIKEDNPAPLYTKERCHIKGMIYIKERCTQRNDVNKGIVRRLHNLVIAHFTSSVCVLQLVSFTFYKEDEREEGEEEVHKA